MWTQSLSFRKRNARPAGDSSQVRKSLLFFVTKASRVEWTQKRNQKFIPSWKFGRAEIRFRYQTFDDSSGNFLTCNWTHITRKISRRIHTIVQVTQFATNFLSNTQKCLANRKVILLQNWIQTNDRKTERRASAIDDDGWSSRTKLKTETTKKWKVSSSKMLCGSRERKIMLKRTRNQRSSRAESFSVPPCTSFLVYMTNLLWNFMMLFFLAEIEQQTHDSRWFLMTKEATKAKRDLWLHHLLFCVTFWVSLRP